MTRGQIKAYTRSNVMAYIGTDEASDPIALDRKLSTRANELANLLDSLYLDYFSTITIGVTDYCASSLYKIDRVLLQQADGKWFDAGMPNVSSEAYGSQWQTNPETGDPKQVILYGTNMVRLYPVPAVTVVNGIHWWGFGTCEGTWNAETAECPLPTIMHPALIEALSADWLMTAPIMDPARKKAAMMQAEYHERRYKYMKGHLESDAGTISENARIRTDHKIALSSPNPLNLGPGPLNTGW